MFILLTVRTASCLLTYYNFQEIDHETDYQTFRKKWGNDPRFMALDRKDRENLLNERYHLDSSELLCAQ